MSWLVGELLIMDFHLSIAAILSSNPLKATQSTVGSIGVL